MECAHNAHLYYLLLPPHIGRDGVLADLNRRGINAVFHYVPLHASPAGRKFGRVATSMAFTEERSEQLIRMPLWVGMSDDTPGRVLEGLTAALASHV